MMWQSMGVLEIMASKFLHAKKKIEEAPVRRIKTVCSLNP